MIDRRSIQTYAFGAVGVIGAIAIMFAPRMVFSHPAAADGAYVAATLACVAVAFAWALWFSVAAFRRAEEFAQERTKFAWYWGSMAGVVVAVLIYGLIASGAAPGLLEGVTPIRAFGFGMASLLVAQLAGRLVLSAWWRATKR
ncbi:hypothetical protein [Phenylobacterium sp.]|jgi:hypothetical protein|uniref:hypothetical protein n=1 Tax=Phenylobacterium sp. TaxID=1871053 RepID=UPI002F42AE6B